MSRATLFFSLKLTKDTSCLDWLENETQEADEAEAERYPDLEHFYTLYAEEANDNQELNGIYLEVSEAERVYHTVPFTDLIMKYLQEYEPEGSVHFQAWCHGGDSDDEKLLYIITATDWVCLCMDSIKAVMVHDRYKKFFRELCCVVCELDVLSEGGRHHPDCPVGALFGKDGLLFRQSGRR